MKNKNTISIITLGCKVNEYESLSMFSELKNAGYNIKTGYEFADTYIINTCAVTNMAERKSRQVIAKIIKINKDAKIIVTGCASQHNPNQFYEYKNVTAVLGNADKNNILKYLDIEYKSQLKELPSCYEDFCLASINKTRHYIKVQDGCNNFCSYCIIPYLRGRSRSRYMQDIINEIKNCGAKEIVLTGINVSDYRQDGKLALIDLLEEIDKLNIRFRLSSLECVIINDDFLIRLKKLNNFCQFFHLSLQSACNATLKRMNRHYTIEEYINVCNQVKKYFPSSCISTDLIVGFKGETNDEFNQTLNNLKKIPFAFMHIFPYSIRQGTNAEKMGGDVASEVVKSREKQLIEYNKSIKKRFYKDNLFIKQKVLIEENDGEYVMGYTENYIYTYFKGGYKVGEIVEITFNKVMTKNKNLVLTIE